LNARPDTDCEHMVGLLRLIGLLCRTPRAMGRFSQRIFRDEGI
jgi:hypothetical protein